MSELSSGKKFPLRKGGARGLFFLWAVALLLCGATVILSLSKDAYAFKLPDTGQTKCYQSVSPWAEISCSGTGQDGAYNINPKSYSIIGSNSDMVQDNNTGLIWQRQDDGNYYNWYQATGEVNSSYNPSGGSYKNICGDLNLGGYSDWRLPSKKELITIVDYSIPYPGPTINSVFTGTQQSYYWSSTTSAPDGAWVVAFYSGYVGYGSKSYDYFHVRCVRGEEVQTSFVDNGLTVSDTRTGLIWQKQDDGISRTWGEALSYCEGLPLGGYPDWRLPNIIELESITDDSRYIPAIDPVFTGTQQSYYWSSITVAYDPGSAWSVEFAFGGVENYSKNNQLYVRCIRAEQSGVSLTGLTLTGAASVNENSTTTYTATASWSDGSTSTVTPKWSEDSAYATISAAGLLTTTSAPVNQTITVTAEYTAGNVTKTAAKSVTMTGNHVTEPANGTEFTACSYYAPPVFRWQNSATFSKMELQFSLSGSFLTVTKVKAPVSTSLAMTLKSWKTIMTLGSGGNTVYWRVAGTNANKTISYSNTGNFRIMGLSPAGNLLLNPVSKSSLPTMSWDNNCGTSFKILFGSSSGMASRTLSRKITDPTTNSGLYSGILTTKDWLAIRNVVGDFSGATVYWQVQSWDILKRSAATGWQSFVLTP